jgi:hypothetical protein
LQDDLNNLLAITSLRRAVARNETCPCCGSLASEPNSWHGCDCGDPQGDVLGHGDCANHGHSLSYGCGMWQMWMDAIVGRNIPYCDEYDYSMEECRYVGALFTSNH